MNSAAWLLLAGAAGLAVGLFVLRRWWRQRGQPGRGRTLVEVLAVGGGVVRDVGAALRASRSAPFALRLGVESARYRLRHGAPGRYLAHSSLVPGWTRGAEAFELLRVGAALPREAVIVEVGSFLGAGTICLAGSCAWRGGGRVHAIDPFDASGDPHSRPVYEALAAAGHGGLRQRFERNLAHAGLRAWVEIHAGTAQSVAATWREPIDLLFLDGDQSPEGARAAFDCWIPFLRPGGILALHNTADRAYAPDHDGMLRVRREAVRAPFFDEIRLVDTTTFARKLIAGGVG